MLCCLLVQTKWEEHQLPGFWCRGGALLNQMQTVNKLLSDAAGCDYDKFGALAQQPCLWACFSWQPTFSKFCSNSMNVLRMVCPTSVGLLQWVKEKINKRTSVLMLCVEMPPGRPHSTEIFKQDKHECIHPVTHLLTIQKDMYMAWIFCFPDAAEQAHNKSRQIMTVGA